MSCQSLFLYRINNSFPRNHKLLSLARTRHVIDIPVEFYYIFGFVEQAQEEKTAEIRQIHKAAAKRRDLF